MTDNRPGPEGDFGQTRPMLTVSGTVKTPGKGTYRKPTPKADTSVRTVVPPAFAVTLLQRRRAQMELNPLDAVFTTRNGTWHQVGNIERIWRSIRKETGYEWATPHTFRKTVATLISEEVGTEDASRQLGHSSSDVTRSTTSPRRRWPVTMPSFSKRSPVISPRTGRVRADR